MNLIIKQLIKVEVIYFKMFFFLKMCYTIIYDSILYKRNDYK